MTSKVAMDYKKSADEGKKKNIPGGLCLGMGRGPRGNSANSLVPLAVILNRKQNPAKVDFIALVRRGAESGGCARASAFLPHDTGINKTTQQPSETKFSQSGALSHSQSTERGRKCRQCLLLKRCRASYCTLISPR